MLTDWLHELHNWGVAAAIRRSLYIYPVLSAGHIFSLTLLLGGIIPADLKMLGFFRNVATPPFLRLMTAIAATGLSLAVATGFLLFSVQPIEYVSNVAFLTKITLVALGALNALAIRVSGAWRTALATAAIGTPLKLAAGFSLAIWIAALVAGRTIAFL